MSLKCYEFSKKKFLWNFYTTLSYTNTIWKIFFENFLTPVGLGMIKLKKLKGKTIYVQILLMVFKCYIWGLPWKNYGISIFFQSQKWIRFVIKQLLPNNSWYWWLYQSSKVKNCDISKWQKCDLDHSSREVFICNWINLKDIGC